MRKIILLAVLFTLGLLTQAQQVGPNISWDATTFSFGDVKEDGGKVSHKYIFTNTGNAPLVLTRVKPSCGCTSSDYTKQPVAPGKEGYVSVAFDPNRRVGKNSKSITVTSNSVPPTTVLRFTVNVLARAKTIEDDYPRTIGELRLKTNHLALMKVFTNEVKEGELDIVNTNDHDLNIAFQNIPAYIQISAVPSILKPNMKGKIIVKYDASKKDDYGFLMDRIIIAINENTNQNKNRLSVSATIEEDFTQLSAKELADAPNIEFDNKVFNFGELIKGESVEHTFVFKNTGKSDLIIRKTKSSCGCTVVNPSDKVIKPGEASKLKVKFNSAGKKNKQNKSITVITNSPKNSQVVLRVTGFVKDPSDKK